MEFQNHTKDLHIRRYAFNKLTAWCVNDTSTYLRVHHLHHTHTYGVWTQWKAIKSSQLSRGFNVRAFIHDIAYPSNGLHWHRFGEYTQKEVASIHTLDEFQCCDAAATIFKSLSHSLTCRANWIEFSVFISLFEAFVFFAIYFSFACH